MKKNPKITVIMPTYNRCELLKEALSSILTQTYKDFELIIIDDCSDDGTLEYLTEQAKKDDRIIYIRNKKHRHYNYGLRLGCKMAKGEYIARMDDDDVSLPERFEKQVKFLNENPDIAVVGTFFELLGDDGVTYVWVDNSRPEFCALDAFYRCPLCHPTVMIRKSFLQEKNVGYDAKALYAEDTMLWIDIILAGGKIANIPEILLKYRVGHTRVSAGNTVKIQNETAYRAREKMWRLYVSAAKAKELSRISPIILKYNANMCNALMEVAEKNLDIFPRETVYEYLVHMGVKREQMHICFAGNNQIAEKMCVAITSVVRHMRLCDTIDFFILEDDISLENKKKIKKLEKNNVAIEFIHIDKKTFENRCPQGKGCIHVPVQTYFRYLIPQLKPDYDKVLYLDCDVIVRSTLFKLWEIDLGDNYVAAVQEFYCNAINDMKIKLPIIFNAGVLLLNNKKLVDDNITDKLFKNTDKLKDKIVYVDQDILNYTFQNKVLWIDPVYNAQINLFRPGICANPIYPLEAIKLSRWAPVIVHYNGPNKPWNKKGYKELRRYYPYVNEYNKNLMRSPFKSVYWKNKIKKILFFTEKKEVVLQKEKNGYQVKNWAVEYNELITLKPMFGKESITVCFSSDDIYAPYLAVAVSSLKQNKNEKDKYDVCILDYDISDRNKEKISLLKDDDFSVRFIPIKRFFEQYDQSLFSLNAYFTLATYCRFFIPDIFKEYEKVLYLDCDIAIHNDIAELYQCSLDGYAVGAVPDVEVLRCIENDVLIGNQNAKDYLRNTLHMQNPKDYFQAGVLILDIPKLLQQNFTTKCIEKLKEIKKPVYVDQCILNAVIDGHYKKLDFKWNVMWQIPYYIKDLNCQIDIKIYEKYMAAYNAPYIIHYASSIKPWKNHDIKLAEIWWQYARQTVYYEQFILNLSALLNMQSMKLVFEYRKNCFKYYRYKLLSKITFGKKRKKYREKKKQYRQKIKSARLIMKKYI